VACERAGAEGDEEAMRRLAREWLWLVHCFAATLALAFYLRDQQPPRLDEWLAADGVLAVTFVLYVVVVAFRFTTWWARTVWMK
jgi:hypothetical protein